MEFSWRWTTFAKYGVPLLIKKCSEELTFVDPRLEEEGCKDHKSEAHSKVPTLASSSTGSCSPPPVCPYNFRHKRQKAPAKMSNRASWDVHTTKILLELCIEQKNLLNWSDRCLTKLGWKHVHSRFRAATGLQLGRKQLQNKLNNLRRQFFGWRLLENKTGLGRDKETGGVSADATYWEEDQQDTQARSQPPSVKPPPCLDLLFELFGHEPQDRGTLLSAGGIREDTPSMGGTPSMGTEGNFVDLEDEQAPPSSARFSARAKGKRPVREYSVDSPTKKRSDTLEQYIRDISDSVAKRSLQRGPSGHEATNRCLQILKEDGIEQGSELHNQVMYCCAHSSDCRSTFLGLDTKDARLSWINFYWNLLQKK